MKKNWKKTEEPRMVRKYKVKNNDYINISKNITKKIIFILHSSFAKKKIVVKTILSLDDDKIV